MRLLHTADWHLGRTLFEARLVEDQAHVLDRLLEAAADARPDAVVVAGDVFDRPQPPADAVRLLDDVLHRLVRGLGLPVVMIAGNHDGPERIGFASGLLADGGLHVRGLPEAACAPVVLSDAHGEVRVYPVPYAEPAALRAVLGDPTAVCHDSAAAAVCGRIRAAHPPSARSVLVAHPFVVGGAESESERPLVHVGGAGAVRAETLAGFDYVAMGHLHRPQSLGPGGRLRYAGSILKYSASEIGHAKSATLVELGPPGAPPAVREVPLVPRRDLRVVEGLLAELLERPPEGGRDDYLIVRLTDDGPVYDAMAKLRRVFPNALAVDRTRSAWAAAAGAAAADHRRTSPEDLFAAFWAEVSDRPLDAARLAAFRAALAEDEAPAPAEAAP
jgi:exonuclease SbcD